MFCIQDTVLSAGFREEERTRVTGNGGSPCDVLRKLSRQEFWKLCTGCFCEKPNSASSSGTIFYMIIFEMNGQKFFEFFKKFRYLKIFKIILYNLQIIFTNVQPMLSSHNNLHRTIF